jgi:DNA-binding PadR family transcriptional regulator
MRQLTPDETILGLLAVRARHGYELLECFRDPGQLGEVWKLSTSQLYAVLKRLEARGLTRGSEIAVADAPSRTEYVLTGAGKARLQAWLDESHPSDSIRRVRVEFLSRLYIARLLNIPTWPIVERQKAACRQKKAELLVCLENALPGVGRLTLELVIAQLDAVLQWLERCELTSQER